MLILLFASSCVQHRNKPEPEPRLLGVPESMVEQEIVNIIAQALDMPLGEGQYQMERLFNRIVREHEADTSRFIYLKLTELVSKYLYDPNSPLRDEDLYLPFVSRMAKSIYTPEESRAAYEYEAANCTLNPRESKATDFTFRTAAGKKMHLYDVESEYAILFFSNPGCSACKEIVEMLKEDFVCEMLSDGRLSVVNVYIDYEYEEWLDYCKFYPSDWICGYDSSHSIREELLYDVRAIPSVYLLDSSKRVMLKDADVQRMMSRLFNLYNLNNR